MYLRLEVLKFTRVEVIDELTLHKVFKGTPFEYVQFFSSVPFEG